jgi:hypothetical protein
MAQLQELFFYTERFTEAQAGDITKDLIKNAIKVFSFKRLKRDFVLDQGYTIERVDKLREDVFKAFDNHLSRDPLNVNEFTYKLLMKEIAVSIAAMSADQTLEDWGLTCFTVTSDNIWKDIRSELALPPALRSYFTQDLDNLVNVMYDLNTIDAKMRDTKYLIAKISMAIDEKNKTLSYLTNFPQIVAKEIAELESDIHDLSGSLGDNQLKLLLFSSVYNEYNGKLQCAIAAFRKDMMLHILDLVSINPGCLFEDEEEELKKRAAEYEPIWCPVW